MKPSRKTTDGSDDPWAHAVDPVPDSRPPGGASEPGPHAATEPGAGHVEPGEARDEVPGAEDDTVRDAPSEEPPVSPADRLAEEARRLAEALAGQLDDVRHEVRDKVVEPLMRRHPDVAAHLGAAGSELLSAYRAFVAARERRWASRSAPAERVTLDLDDAEEDDETSAAAGPEDRRSDDGAPTRPPTERGRDEAGGDAADPDGPADPA